MAVFRCTRIQMRIAIVLGAAFGLIVAVAAVGLWQLDAAGSAAREAQQVWLARAAILEDIEGTITEHRLLSTLRAETPSLREAASLSSDIDAVTKAVSTALAAYRETIRTLNERDRFAEFESRWDDYLTQVNSTLSPLEGKGGAGTIGKFGAVTEAAFNGASETLRTIIADTDHMSDSAVERAAEVHRFGLYTTSAVVMIAAGLALAFVFWTSHTIGTPLSRITEAMRRLAEGDLSATVPDYGGRGDEIGVLAAAVNGYRDSLVRGVELSGEAARDRQRLYEAVDNMPIGLSMFDSEKRLVVCNTTYTDIYDIPANVAVPGTPLVDILRARGPAGMDVGRDSEEHVRHRMETLERGETFRDMRELVGGQWVCMILQPLKDGGWLAIHEDITERRQAEAKIHYLASHDALTDLPNRSLFNERVEEALSSMEPGDEVAVLCLDLNRFKAVNDALGHPIGDKLLKYVAGRLAECAHDAHCVARLGGDEFAIVQTDLPQPDGATKLARRLIESLTRPFDVDGHQVAVGTSVGIALAPSDGDDAAQLMKNSDLALYRAKSEASGTYHFFEPEMDRRMQARRMLELDLRRAFADEEFELHYQPLIRVDTKEICSFEALLRWRNRERGLVAPEEFIPLAEEIGLIVPLGDWILRQACRDAASWPDSISVAVNLSPVQFRGDKLLESVITAVAVSGIAPTRLQLEITESVLLANNRSTLTTLHKLRAYGVRISMDDFGTGYSSLSYLRSFPFDKIKIDRSFISDLSTETNSLAIVRAVTGLSNSMGMQTTAEGVETEEQFDRVRQEGCTEAQGYLFAAAMPAAEIAGLLSDWPAGEATAKVGGA